MTNDCFPIDSLGDVLANAVREVSSHLETPIELPAQAALGVVSALCQRQFNVNIFGSPEPASLYFLTMAASGERKSAVSQLMNHPLIEWDKRKHTDFVNAKKRHKRELEDCKDLKKRNIECPEPPEPMHQRIVEHNVTIEALERDLIKNYPCKYLCTAEAGQLFGNFSFSAESVLGTLTNLSNIWDGGSISRARMGNDFSEGGYDRRLTIGLMAQPEIAAKIIRNPLALHQGFLARFLICNPASNVGYRNVNLRSRSTPFLDSYYDRVNDLLRTEPCIDDGGGLKLGTMIISDDGIDSLQAYSRKIEVGMRPDGCYVPILGFASKLPAHIGRLACCLAYFDGDREITQSTVERAVSLGEFYLGEQLALFQDHDERRDELCDFIGRRGGEVTIRQIREGAPKSVGLRGATFKLIRQQMQSFAQLGLVEPYSINQKGLADSWRLLK